MPDMGQGHTPTHRRVQKDQQKNRRQQIALASRLVLTAHAQRVDKGSNVVQFKSRPLPILKQDCDAPTMPQSI